MTIISKSLFRYNLAGIYQCDTKGVILDCNDAFAQIVGYSSASEIIGKNSGDLYENLSNNRIIDVVGEADATKSLESLLRLQDGREVYVLEDAVMVSGSKRNSIIGTLLDITDHKRAQQEKKESEEKYRFLIQNLPTAIYTTDASGHILIYNKAAIELWGREPIIGKDLWCGFFRIYDLDGKDLPAASSPMAACINEQRPVYGEQIIVERPDGTTRIIEPHTTPIFSSSGKFKGAINMLIDVTKQKKYIKAIEDQNKKLVDIAWTQSHMVRGPLARMLGLLNLIENHKIKAQEKFKFLKLLKDESLELDKAVKAVVRSSEFHSVDHEDLGLDMVNVNSRLN